MSIYPMEKLSSIVYNTIIAYEYSFFDDNTLNGKEEFSCWIF